MTDIKDVKVCMKPLISYYGGKQNLSRDICCALYQSPNWSVKGHYIEPFFGGGAVFFAKEPQEMETINDANDSLITFYRVIKDPAGFEKVRALLEGTLCSRSDFNRAVRILKGLEYADDALKAWAVFVHLNQSFGNGWFKSMSYVVGATKGGRSKGKRLQNKIERFTEEYVYRLKNACIECGDALDIIRMRDSEISLFYIDPPYAGCFQCYGEWTFNDNGLSALIDELKQLKGRFVLSGYAHPLIDDAAEERGWTIAKKGVFCRVWSGGKGGKQVTQSREEILVANYPFSLDGWENDGQEAAATQGELFV